jgi:Fic family protein
MVACRGFWHLLLLQQGYVVGRYISLERLTEEAKDDYYATLQQSSQGWHEGQHDLIPWLNHFLGTIRRAYAELERQVEAFHPEKGSKSQWVQEVIAKQPGSFSVVELEAQCPGVSRDLIRGILKRLRQEGAVKSLGRGPGALWRKRVNPPEKG